MLDVGCGAGYAQSWFHERGLKTLGIDCQQVLEHHVLKDGKLTHAADLTHGAVLTENKFDLVWSCEVGEHLEPRFVQHFVDTVSRNCSKVVALCAAPVGAGGYHHVNCQDPPYWIGLLTQAGLTYRDDLTRHAKKLCTTAHERSENNYFRRSGIILTKVTANG
jgi:2-polyprenyl-3-methyl-5-hydroxy-6-metoxy-1,4-benzoquinol methylase